MSPRADFLSALRSRPAAALRALAAAGALGAFLMAQQPAKASPPSEAPRPRPAFPSAQEIASLPPDGGPKYNRLVFEKSPYLLQHAANPVDWRPWGEEAFAEARAQDKPVFLSIGYATCHWCHVMEHESFEDEEAAALLNEYFIPIKVDRKERPDVDHIYMTYCQLSTGRGGWPLTIAMTPDREPFFAGTYFPKLSRGGRIGLMDLSRGIHRAWTEDREAVVEQAGGVAARLKEAMAGGDPGESLGVPEIRAALRQLAGRFDPDLGGFGSSPKFPTPHNLSLLLRAHKRFGDPQALAMVEKTLQRMRLGGVYDHVGHGFHRYSTDPEWFLPHFEKMLYDQALMTIAAVEAWQATGDDQYAGLARDVLSYVLRDMQAPEGGFYCAEDADSEGEEGLFYLWKPEEILEALGGDQESADLFMKAYNFDLKNGNYYEEATGHFTGRNIPHLKKPLAELAPDFGMEPAAFEAKIEAIRQKLFHVREGRVHPLKDDKILTDWNGLMIAACAQAGRALDEPKYIAAAERAAEFVLRELRTEDGRLLKRWRAGEAGLPAHLDDYAFMAWGLFELYEATFDARWLAESKALADAMIEHFHDDERGGFFMTASDSEELLARAKEIYDGAIPSGNSVAALVLAKLARATGESAYEDKAIGVGKAFAEGVERGPSAHAMLLQAVDFLEGPSLEIVIAGDPASEGAKAMLRALRTEFLPNKVALLRPDGEAGDAIAKLAPFAEGMGPIDGKAAAYVCQNQACQLPTISADDMMKQIRASFPQPEPLSLKKK